MLSRALGRARAYQSSNSTKTVVSHLKSNLRKTPTGIFLEIFSSTINTIEIILSQKLNLECSESVKYKRMSLSGGLETIPFRVVWL